MPFVRVDNYDQFKGYIGNTKFRVCWLSSSQRYLVNDSPTENPLQVAYRIVSEYPRMRDMHSAVATPVTDRRLINRLEKVVERQAKVLAKKDREDFEKFCAGN